MIRSFRDRLTGAVFRGDHVKGVHPDLARRARKTMRVLNRATSLNDLRGAGLSLEKLGHDRAGQHAIRVNEQWRICFIWKEGDVHAVELTDYH